MIVVSNAFPLISPAKIKQLNILQKLFFIEGVVEIVAYYPAIQRIAGALSPSLSNPSL